MPPLALSATHRGEWECTTCSEDYNTRNDQPWETVDGRSLVYAGCIIQQFEKALENDLSWPARFGAAALDISDFDSMLPARLRLLLLLLKVEEYANRRNDDSRLDAVRDQTRGVDYQLCPGCGKIVILQDGCNHMTCPCMASFCFICGKEAAGTSNHWLTSRCPRYGVPKTYQEDYDPFPTETNLANAANWGGMPDFVELWARFRIEIWAWNVAMQESQDDEARRMMQERPQAPLWQPSLLETATISRLLRRYHSMHAVTNTQWEALITADTESIEEFLADGPAIRPERSQWTHNGVLLRPVGGVFNMAVHSGRLEAFLWMHDTVRNWGNHSINSPRSSAVFQIGPGGDEDTRVHVARMMVYLGIRGHRAALGRISFNHVVASALIVTVNPPLPAPWGDRMIDVSEAWWRQHLLCHFWTPVVRLERHYRLDRRDTLWSSLWRQAEDDWARQMMMPGIWENV
jgi:hypothetical protein